MVSDGINWWWGEIGTGFRWKSDDIVDSRSRVELTVYWSGSSRVRKPHADVTLRRIRNFTPRPGYEYTWQYRTAKGEVLQSGKIVPGKGNVMVFRAVPVSPEGTRIVVMP